MASLFPAAKDYLLAFVVDPEHPQSKQVLAAEEFLLEDFKNDMTTCLIDVTKIDEENCWLKFTSIPEIVLFDKLGTELGRVVGPNMPELVSLLSSTIKSKEAAKVSASPSVNELEEFLKILKEKKRVVLVRDGQLSSADRDYALETLLREIIGVPFDILEVDKEHASKLSRFTACSSHPKLFVDGKFAGGLEQLFALRNSGNLISRFSFLNLNDRLKNLINAQPMMIFMKGEKNAPFCRFSKELLGILRTAGLKQFGTFNVFEDEEVKEGLKIYSSWPTYPQIYIKGEFIGGLDVIKQTIEQAGGIDLFAIEINQMLHA